MLKRIKVTIASYYTEEHIRAMRTLIKYLNGVQIVGEAEDYYILDVNEEILQMFDELSLCDCCHVELQEVPDEV